MNGLDLFSGIGGISLALKDYVRPIAYCEIEPYCQGILLSRMHKGHLVHAPIWDDIKTLRIRPQTFDIDIIYGGFPCQDISNAGHGKGLEGERSGLFFEIVRLCREIKPRFIFLENVPAITTRGGIEVVRQIAALGYGCRWCVISAASVGALHRRERWFLLAHTNESTDRGGIRRLPRKDEEEWKSEMYRKNETSKSFYGSEDVCDSNCRSSEQTNKGAESEQAEGRIWRGHTRQCWPFESVEHWQKTVSEMGKCSDGIPFRVDRLRGLGNSVVPQQVKKAFEILMGIDPMAKKKEVRE